MNPRPGWKFTPNGPSPAGAPTPPQAPSWPCWDPGDLRPKEAMPHQSPTGLWVSEFLKHFLNPSLFQEDSTSGESSWNPKGPGFPICGILVIPSPHCLPDPAGGRGGSTIVR